MSIKKAIEIYVNKKKADELYNMGLDGRLPVEYRKEAMKNALDIWINHQGLYLSVLYLIQNKEFITEEINEIKEYVNNNITDIIEKIIQTNTKNGIYENLLTMLRYSNNFPEDNKEDLINKIYNSLVDALDNRIKRRIEKGNYDWLECDLNHKNYERVIRILVNSALYSKTQEKIYYKNLIKDFVKRFKNDITKDIENKIERLVNETDSFRKLDAENELENILSEIYIEKLREGIIKAVEKRIEICVHTGNEEELEKIAKDEKWMKANIKEKAAKGLIEVYIKKGKYNEITSLKYKSGIWLFQEDEENLFKYQDIAAKNSIEICKREGRYDELYKISADDENLPRSIREEALQTLLRNKE